MTLHPLPDGPNTLDPNEGRALLDELAYKYEKVIAGLKNEISSRHLD